MTPIVIACAVLSMLAASFSAAMAIFNAYAVSGVRESTETAEQHAHEATLAAGRLQSAVRTIDGRD